MPRRIQRQQTKGWRMPEGAVFVGRPTLWGNPWQPGKHGCPNSVHLRDHDPDADYGVRMDALWWRPIGATTGPADAVETYRLWLIDGVPSWTLMKNSPNVFALGVDILTWNRMRIIATMPDLRGHDLACRCPLDRPCHADVLLEMANA